MKHDKQCMLQLFVESPQICREGMLFLSDVRWFYWIAQEGLASAGAQAE